MPVPPVARKSDLNPRPPELSAGTFCEFTLGVLLVMSGLRLSPPGQEDLGVITFHRFAGLGILLLGIVAASSRSRKVALPGAAEKLLWLYVAWSGISTFWSKSPISTLTCTAHLAILTLASRQIVLARARPGGTAFAWGLFASAFLVVVCSLGLGWTHLGTLGEDRLRGITPHSNHLGAICGLLLVISGGLLLSPAKHRRLPIGLLAAIPAGIYCLWLTSSRTPVIALLAAIALFVFLKLGSWWRRLAAATCLALVALVALPLLADLVQTFMTAHEGAHGDVFSGRVILWGSILRDIVRRPLTGYGAAAYFADQPEAGMGLRGAHSFLLELLVGGGILGALAYLGFVIVSLSNAARLEPMTDAMRDRDFILAVLCYVIVVSLVDTGLGSGVNWQQGVFFCLGLLSSRLIRSHRWIAERVTCRSEVASFGCAESPVMLGEAPAPRRGMTAGATAPREDRS